MTKSRKGSKILTGSTLSSWHRSVQRILQRCLRFIHHHGPAGRLKEKTMRKTLVTIAAVAALILTACGGGGGGGSPAPTTPVAATGSISSSSGCAIPIGQSTCSTASVTYTTANATSPRLTASGVSISTASSGTQTFTIPVGNTSVAVMDGTTTLASATVVGTCAGAADANGVCQPSAYSYAAFNLVVRNDQANTLWYVDDAGTETKLTNNTGFTATGALPNPLTSCGVWDTILADNRPLASCLTPGAGNTRRNFPINPATKELMAEWTGAVPAGATLRSVPYGTFGATPYAAQGIGLQGMYVDLPGGAVLHFTNTDDKLRLTTNNFATDPVVNAGSHNYIVRFPAK